MSNNPEAIVGCHLVGEYIDEAEVPTDMICQPGEVIRPRLVADFVDQWRAIPSASESLSDALVRILQQETDGPSRARILEAFVKLQAVETLREYLRTHESQHASHALDSLGKIFASTDEETLRIIASLRDGSHQTKES